MRRRFQRVVLIVLDGVGIGALPDAARFGDAGAHTLRHVAEMAGGLHLPNLQRLGLGNIDALPGVAPAAHPEAAYGKMAEVSIGKDTPTGHWELAGLQTLEPYATYPDGFPTPIIDAFRQATGLEPLGNVAASGTEIIARLGAEQLRSGRPIVYTSADSVFQIAAHEQSIPPEKLYQICRLARGILDPWRVGRVIARPFVGDPSAGFRRTSRRHDFAMPPPQLTLLDRLASAGYESIGIGKISDIFAGRGLTAARSTADNADGMQQTLASLRACHSGMLFVNLVDFDMLFGHRLDAAGFAQALGVFDAWLPVLMGELRDDDLLLITADHGCDPQVNGTDHTREYVPVLAWHRQIVPQALGVRQSFADVGATIAEAFALEGGAGTSFLSSL